ncbi:class II aldolase/adducin family protein [Parasphingorhabdus halotolerans]|uniref:Class II aldolase/adducin family protein n=1 Tax=Parasphingorhabdus halotolerans TaxID=2725558 RepID=A0A6H2DND8_9SPHN|nr:class II aldolase/adducin family protein [Parasphingorhabdus halotolerans]QJB70182.1 class II aldolase/adducin family protein [Parasphingorhabdus halotolerans]
MNAPVRSNPMLQKLAPRPGRYPLLPELTAHQELALLCRALHREGYDDHVAGHVTLAEPDGSFLVNPWELAWDEVTADDIIRLDGNGSVIEGEWNVTPAIGLHLAVHQRRHDLKVVIHNHPRWGLVWSASGRVPPIYDQTSGQVEGDPVFYDEYAGTVDGASEAEAAAEALGNEKWAILKNHGVFVVAKDISQAHLRAITLEHRCRLAWQVEVLGGGQHITDPESLRMAQMSDDLGFPFLWEAMARKEIRLDARVLGEDGANAIKESGA